MLTATESAPAAFSSRVPLTAAGIPSLLRALGDVPAERVLLDPPPGQATEEDLIRRVDGVDKILCEMVDGTLVEKAMRFRESVLARVIASLLGAFADQHNLGLVAGADAMLRMTGGNIRLPDVSFIAWADVPGGRFPTEPVGRFPATLAVEVLSRGNTRREMEKKYAEFFASGTKEIWEFDPDARTVAIYHRGTEKPTRLLDDAQTLTCETILPGFSLALAGVFAELDRRAGQGGQAV